LENLDGATLENDPGFSLLIDQDTSLIVEATDGCALRMDTISITAIPAPEISLIPGNPSCGDASGFINMEIEGGVPPFLIEWENPEGMLIAGNVTTVINLLSGSYQMTLIDDAGCIFTENILLVDEGTPETTVVVEDINCAGESTGAITVDILGGVAPFNYAWAVDGQAISTNSAVLTDLAPGNYALTFTDADECSLIIEDLILSAPSPLQFDVVVNSPDCPGEASGSINIINISGGTLPYDFRIDGAPFQRDSTFTNLSAGQYELILQDAQGCDTLLQAEVPAANDIDIELTVNQNPASIGESLQFQVLGIELLNPVLAINWQSDPTIALSCLDCTSPTATAIASGHVVVDVITENSCTFTDSLLLTVAKDARIYIPTAFSPNGDGRNDLFEVFPGIGIAEISDFEIYNRWGGLVFQSSVDGAGWDGTINGAPAPAGVYVYLVTVRWLDGMVKQYSGEIQLLR
jgi:gliding motility-associated-like protein